MPGLPVDNPNNIWRPFGPMVQHLAFQYYASPNDEFNAFFSGKLDLTDSPLPLARFGSVDLNPDFTLSPVAGQFAVFGIFFNGASSTWANWGCNWGNSTGTEYTSQCGIEMRQAFAHLVNRGDFAHNNVASPSVSLADDSPSSKIPAGTPWAKQCSWDQSVMVNLATSCYSRYGVNAIGTSEPGAYTITGSGGPCTPTTPGSGPAQLYQACSAGTGFPAVGSPDFCAAALHMINAGVATGMTSSCVLTGVNPGVFSHPLRFVIRTVNPRLTLGNGFFNEVSLLFGGPAIVHGCIGGIICTLNVFFDQPGQIDDWDGYTYGYLEQGPFGGDALFGLYHSSQSAATLSSPPVGNGLPGGPVCNGALGSEEPNNPTFMCNPVLDSLLNAQSASKTIDQYNAATLAAMDYIGRIANDVPAYSPGIRTIALSSVAGLVNARASGFNNVFTLLNARQDPSYTPVNPTYAFGGGDPTTLRYGQASPPSVLNIFNAQTTWDFQALGEIYDTLFSANPVNPTQIFCWMCDSYTQSVDSSGNTHFLITLRQNLRWQDGVRVDAKDVAFSLLAFKYLGFNGGGSGIFGTPVRAIMDLSSTRLEVVFNGQSPFLTSFLEQFIVPRHIWECDFTNVPTDCTDGAALINSFAPGGAMNFTRAGVNVPSAARASFSFDPLASNMLIGSGPFECKSIFAPDLGSIGGGCAVNDDGSRGTQEIPVGGKLLLTAFDNTGPGTTDPFDQYMRSFNPNWGMGTGTAAESGQYQEFVYSDIDGNKVVSLTDLASVAACFGASGATATCSASNYAHWQRSSFETVPGTISGEAAIVAAHYGDYYVFPYPWDPHVLENIYPGISLCPPIC